MVRDIGFRRVDWVRVFVDNGRMRAEAVGVGFRLPAVCSIPLATAANLIAGGTPHVTHVTATPSVGR
ncbi:MAG TPA: hypothetical protein VHY77_05680 [Acidimicrobiales bacterium]|jgi:hypothetical protein|nr:hypothetical protein [Acidimicrobiales bacterium]